MSNEQVAPETKGVTVKLLATVDLGPEIEGMAGRQLRMRRVTMEPGSVFGPRTETPPTGLRTGERLRLWKFRSISSSQSDLGPGSKRGNPALQCSARPPQRRPQPQRERFLKYRVASPVAVGKSQAFVADAKPLLFR
jgi:hypothetical protein